MYSVSLRRVLVGARGLSEVGVNTRARWVVRYGLASGAENLTEGAIPRSDNTLLMSFFFFFFAINETFIANKGSTIVTRSFDNIFLFCSFNRAIFWFDGFRYSLKKFKKAFFMKKQKALKRNFLQKTSRILTFLPKREPSREKKQRKKRRHELTSGTDVARVRLNQWQVIEWPNNSRVWSYFFTLTKLLISTEVQMSWHVTFIMFFAIVIVIAQVFAFLN